MARTMMTLCTFALLWLAATFLLWGLLQIGNAPVLGGQLLWVGLLFVAASAITLVSIWLLWQRR